MKTNPKTRQKNIVVQELPDEILVYDLESNKAFCLNQTLALVWQYCDGQNSVTEISNLISQKLKVFAGEDFVRLALDKLQKAGLLEKTRDFAETFSPSSRREIIKKIGLTSMAALPIISSVVAPSSLMAQSGQPAAVCSGFCECTSINGDPAGCSSCASGCRCAELPFSPTNCGQLIIGGSLYITCMGSCTNI